MSCQFCDADGGEVLWRDNFCRVVQAATDRYPGYCRVILNQHVSEMSDLITPERERLMRVVFACEEALRRLYHPDKVNLASLGNQVPHLHWHVIARFADDAHFPEPIWAARRRPGAPRQAVENQALVAQLGELLQ